uniref:SixA phosphatase family protein n=1 Tax=Algoriphagus sp. TaxID=1872435 RepID=UPI004048386B
MKKIILIRHAKSSRDNPWLDDYERPLAERGLLDAPKMAASLKKRGIDIDLICSSSAQRAKQTASITAEVLGYPEEKIYWDKSLYHASANHLLQFIQSQSDQIQTLAVVGHNPGLTELINLLGVNLDNLPTAGQFAFSLATAPWRELNKNTCSYFWIDYPKKN